MNIREAIKVISINLNLKTEFAPDSSIRFDLNNINEERFYLNQKNCLELAQAFMVLSANIKRTENQ